MNGTIDVYIDINNRNNLWGLIKYNDVSNRRARKKEEIVRFGDYQSMWNYVNSSFLRQNIAYHQIDYGRIEYYAHNGKPDLNYVAIKFNEYINKVWTPKEIKLPEEYENMFVEMVKINKRIALNAPLGPRYHQDIDVYEEKSDKRKELATNIKMSLEDFFNYAGYEIKKIIFNRKTVKRLIVVAAIATLIVSLGKGYKLVKDNEENSKFLSQNNHVSDFEDINVYANKGRIGIIFGKLLKRDYTDIDKKDVKDLVSFFRKTENSNYDNNASLNIINYNDLEMNIDDYVGNAGILKEIEKKYNKCFHEENGKYVFDKEKANEYIDFVLSLTVMYDAYPNKSTIRINDNSVRSYRYASTDQINAFNHLPPVLRFVILNQLRTMMLNSNYQVQEKASYYFKDTDKQSLINEVNDKISECIDELYVLCKKKDGNKTI